MASVDYSVLAIPILTAVSSALFLIDAVLNPTAHGVSKMAMSAFMAAITILTVGIANKLGALHIPPLLKSMWLTGLL